jgi:hypothetical protein
VSLDPPDWLRSPELLDPYTGAPLRWSRSGSTLRILSVGPNGREDAESKKGDDIGVTWNVASPQ